MRRVNLIYGFLSVFGLVAIVCAAEPVKGSASQRLDSIEAKLQPLYGKSGIYFGGNFYSRALTSKLSGDDSSVVHNTTAKTTEDVLYTGLDLSVNARPLDAIGATAIIRMYTDWRNMFGSMANPLTLRWISIDGNAKDFFVYNIGDFAQKYTKFTLWVPEPEIMFEPTVFARQREIAMGEEFLGGNARVMQGANFNFGANVAPGLRVLKLGGYATRLRQVGKEMLSSDENTMQGVDNFYVDMDRYSFAFNTDMTFVPGTQIGGTFLYVGDAKRTANMKDDDAQRKAKKDAIFSGRVRLGSELFSAIDSEKVNFGLGGEFAGSNYTYTDYDNKKKEWLSNTIFGSAFKGGLDGDFNFGKNGLNLDLGFLMNSHNFRNELAQSPALYNRKRNILNSMNENIQPNVFDGLYTSVFSYMPAEEETGIKQPMKKSAWTRSTLTWEEIRGAHRNGLIEQNISPTMPFGEATPNRVGFIGNLGFDFLDKAILLGGDIKILNEEYYDTVFIKSYVPKSLQGFVEFTGGASFNVAKFGDWWAYPFILSGSFKQTSVSNYLGMSGYQNNVSFINGGLYWKFWKRAGFMGGYQVVNSKVDKGASSPVMTTNQSQWATGFEYTVTEGGVLNATIGQVIVDYSANDKSANAEAIKDNYKALRLDLNLTVKF